MSQIRNNQVSSSNPDAMSPGNAQSRSIPGGSDPPPTTSQSQPQQPKPFLNRIPGLDGLTKFDDQSEKENPCRFCCGVSAAARIFIGLNLGYSFLKFFLLLPIPGLVELTPAFLSNFESPPSTSTNGTGQLWHPFPPCFMLPHTLPLIFWDGVYTLIAFVTVHIWVGDVITSSLFLRAVYFPPEGLGLTIFLSNVFMWYNFCYPGILFQSSIYITIISERCQLKKTFPFWILAYALMVTWVVFNALVAKAYRNGVHRASILMAEQELLDGKVMSTPAGVKVEGVGGGVQKLEENPA